MIVPRSSHGLLLLGFHAPGMFNLPCRSNTPVHSIVLLLTQMYTRYVQDAQDLVFQLSFQPIYEGE